MTLRILLLLLLTSVLRPEARAQGFSFNCTRDTTINSCASPACFTLRAVVPDIRTASNTYTVNQFAGTGVTSCFQPYVRPDDQSGIPASLTIDDRYSAAINMGFPFSFFGSTYNSLVASTNGLVSFDVTRANGFSHFGIINTSGTLGASGTNPQNLPSNLYDRAIIMGPYHDLDPSVTSSANRRIQYQTFGTAPYRRWILSFFRVPQFNCNSLIENTHQIVLYESLNIVEVFLFSRQPCATWNEGRAMVGMQNFNRDAAIMAPGRRASDPVWGTTNMNEAWRFIPSGGPQLLKRVELLDNSGAVVATGTTSPGSTGNINVEFSNVCAQVSGLSRFVVRPVYQHPTNAALEMFGSDTVRVNIASGIAATIASTPSNCTPSGSITVNVTAGTGTPPYTYSLNNGTPQAGNVFNNVPGGAHTVTIRDANNCTSTLPVTVATNNTLAATGVSTPSGCNPSGTITITVPAGAGTAPYTYTLNGGTPQSGNVFNNLPAGSYTVVVTDAATCTRTVNVTVAATPPPVIGLPNTLPSGCTPSGTLIVPVTGGTPPLSYSINGGTPQNNHVFNNVAAGTYTVTVTDASGCTATRNNVVVGSTPPVVATAATTPSSCNPSGTITVAVSSGTAPYNYSLNGGTAQNTNVFNALAPGNYTIIVRDARGCADTITATVMPAGALAAVANTTPSGCAPPTGTLTVTVFAGSGTPPYTYSLNGGTPQTSNVFTGLASGSYLVEVRDAGGCTLGVPATVGFTITPEADATATPSGCTPSGSINISVTPGTGTAPFTYTLNGGAPQSSNVFTNLAAGNYLAVVVDARGCRDSIQLSVPAHPALSATSIATPSGCAPPSGTITVTVPAGAGLPPFTYALNGAAPVPTNVFTGVPAGAHIVVVRDAAGCSFTVNDTVDAPPPFTASSATTASGCNPTGSVTITVAQGQGVAPFTYSLNGGAPQPSNTFVNVAAGTYTVVVRDAQGCTTDVPVTVPALPALTATATTTPSGCTPSGSITITVPAGIGVAPFQYQLGTGSTQASNTFTPIGPGTYDLTVRDAVGCSFTFTATIAQPAPLVATVRVNTPSCDAATNGSAIVQPQNGVAPFEFRIGNGPWQLSDSFPALGAGTYDFFFRDASGCVSVAIPATVNPGPQITATAVTTAVSCFGANNGTATLTLSANAIAPFQFSLDNFATTQASSLINGLVSGPHTIWFRDAAGCSNTLSITVATPPELIAGTPVVVRPLCNGATNGSVTLSATGGTAPYTYSFNNSSFATNGTFATGAGTFNAVIRDANNCTVNVSGIVVNQPAQLVFDSVIVGPAACDSIGRITAYISGGIAPYRYQLDNGPMQQTPMFRVPEGAYLLIVRDTNNCTIQRAINMPRINNLTYIPPPVTAICEGDKATLEPQTNATTFVWSGPNIRPNNPQFSSVEVRPVSDTFYRLVYTLGTCTAVDTIEIDVNAAPIPEAGPASAICYGQNAQLNAQPGFVQYQWSPTTYLTPSSNIPNPVVSRPDRSVRYSLHVVDANGCRSLRPDTVTVSVTPPIQVRITPPDTVAYIGDSIRLHAVAAANNFMWLNSNTVAPPNMNNNALPNPTILVEKDEVLRLRVWTDLGCVGEGLFYLRAYRGPEIYVPQAFTPNRDGKNDLLRPVCVGLTTLNYFRVFDRWGQMMYEYKGERRGPEVYNLLSSNIGWDGTLNGKRLSTGTYVWVAEGFTKEGKRIFRKGTTTIIQ